MVSFGERRVGEPSSFISQARQEPDMIKSVCIRRDMSDSTEIDAFCSNPRVQPTKGMAGSYVVRDESTIDFDQTDEDDAQIEYIDLVGNDEDPLWSQAQHLSDLRNRQNSFHVLGKWGAYAALRVISNNLHELLPHVMQNDADATICAIAQEWEDTLVENELVFSELRNRIDIDQSRRQEELRMSPIKEERDGGELESEAASTAPSTPYSCHATASSNSVRWSDLDDEGDCLPDISDLLPSWAQSSESREASTPDLLRRHRCWLEDEESGANSPQSQRSMTPSEPASPIRWSDIEEDDSLPDVTALLPTSITNSRMQEPSDTVAIIGTGVDTRFYEDLEPGDEDELQPDDDDACSIHLETASIASSDSSCFSPIASPISEVAEFCLNVAVLPDVSPETCPSSHIGCRSISPDVVDSASESPLRKSPSQRLHRAFSSLAEYLTT